MRDIKFMLYFRKLLYISKNVLHQHFKMDLSTISTLDYLAESFIVPKFIFDDFNHINIHFCYELVNLLIF